LHAIFATRILPLTCLVVALAMLTAVVLMWGCGDGQERSVARAEVSNAVDVAPAKQDIEDLGGALRELRDARNDMEIQARYPSVHSAAEALAATLAAVATQYEATVTAGQDALSSGIHQGSGQALAHQAQRSPADEDLALAMDSLLMCRPAYAQVSDSYRWQLLLVTRSLDLDHTLHGMQAVTPAIARLLEDQGELRSILTDVSAKSRAVMTEIAMNPVPRRP
jgi:hypothetical protein